MASQEQVRQYLAYWFQLGKGVSTKRGEILPRSVIQGNRYSPEYEAAWQYILENAVTSHLMGTEQTIAELLSPTWEINPCSRCSMPVPLKSPGLPAAPACPCADVPAWPNTEMPSPRDPVDTQTQLSQIRDRLRHITADQA